MVGLLGKWPTDLKSHFFQIKARNSQQLHKKTFNIANHQGKTSQNSYKFYVIVMTTMNKTQTLENSRHRE